MSLREWRDLFRRFLGRGVYPHQLAFLLEIPLRGFLLSPRTLAERLHLTETSKVLEIGPGPGYFSREVARRVPKGHLELFDIQPEMLEKARRKLERAGLRNVGYTQGDASALPFEEGTFDVAFLVAVLGEVTDPAACLRSAYRVLRPGGLLSVTELPGDPDHTPLAELRALSEKAGFELVETFALRGGFTASFRKPVSWGDDPSPVRGETASPDTLESLILDLLEWIGAESRPYSEVMGAWRTSCPRLPVWEDATERGLIARHYEKGLGELVSVTAFGREHLARHRPRR